MKLAADYEVKFSTDGTEDTLEFDLSNPPLSLDFGGKDPSDLVNAEFSPVSKVPAAPFMKECTLNGTDVTATFAAPLPQNDIEQKQAVYSLKFTLVF